MTSLPPPATALERLGDLSYRRRWPVLIVALIVLAGLAAVAAGALSSFVLNRWEAAGTESVAAQEVLRDEFATGNSNLILLVTAAGGDVDDPVVTASATAVADELAEEEAVNEVWSYWSLGGDTTLRSEDGASAMVLAHVTGDATEARAAIAEYIPAYTRDDGAITVRVAGAEAASTQISAQATQDFLRAEVIIIPLMLVLLIFIYRRVSSALLTLGIGLFSVVATLAGLRALTSVVEIASFASNIVLVMGIGLGVDYSLFVISRFREALGRGSSVRLALRETLNTAGRTVVFSGLTVAASVAVLLALPFPFLRSFAYAGVLTVITAAVGALVILPAALAVIGERAARRGVTVPESKPPEQGGWYRVGARVMRRPILWGGGALVALLALASPAIGLQIGVPDVRVLAQGASVRDTYDQLRDDFTTEANDAIQVIETGGASPTDADLGAYAAELSSVDGIAQVNSSVGVYSEGARIAAGDDRLTSRDTARLDVIPTRDALYGTGGDRLVADIRALDSPFETFLVGGYPAQLADFREALLERLPLIAGLILAVTFVLLFLLTGSLLLPLKATVLNLLSIGVMFGVLTTVFQNGFLADVIGFTPVGSLDPAFPILMFCVVYGLSMDYEVFMISRIREEYERTGDNQRAVLVGLQRSAPLITAAALTLAVSFGVYATSSVMYLQMVGIGVAVAIIVDATVIRGILVPSFMRLAGRANWWAPAFLTPIFRRFGLREEPVGTFDARPPAMVKRIAKAR
ncbi:MMPL family transporter [Microbacterium murale]|uniref:RND superfamily putative drug exporter n=1 Tax=Microbacterium murale TaxID=1081040 RepID=A0ABU0P3V7_9MICO|nr:MMPL family transporter [Microbacterium murale]MDQ0642020.1 RND superfamily putative drug exporter [Microbacterium murale]